MWQGCKKESHLPQFCRHHSLFWLIFTFTFLQSSFSFTLTFYALSNYLNSSFCPDKFSLWLSILLSPHFQTTFAFLQVGILLYLATLLFNMMRGDLVTEWLWLANVGFWTYPGVILAAYALVTDEASHRCWYTKIAEITQMKPYRGVIRGWMDGMDAYGLDRLSNFWPLQNRTRSLRNIIIGALGNVGAALADLATGPIYQVHTIFTSPLTGVFLANWISWGALCLIWLHPFCSSLHSFLCSPTKETKGESGTRRYLQPQELIWRGLCGFQEAREGLESRNPHHHCLPGPLHVLQWVSPHTLKGSFNLKLSLL